MADAVKNRVISELKTAYYRWFFISKSLEITGENKRMLQDFVEIAEAKYEVGNGIQQDVLKAQVELSAFIEKIELLRKKEEIVKAKINSILSRPHGKKLGSPSAITKIQELQYSLDEIKQIIDKIHFLIMAVI